MKTIKHCCAIVALIVGLLPFAGGQTCQDHIAEGRSLLEVSNVVEANAQFAAALALCPANEVARFYHAVTAVGALPLRPGPSNFLNRIGVPLEGRNPYNWTALLPQDTNGHFIIPAGFNATEAVALLRNEVLPVITAAAFDLAQIASPGFAVPLSYEETKLADVTVDYGDVLILRAALHALEFWTYSVASWNLDVHAEVLQQLNSAHELSVERVLRDFPQLLTFSTTNDLTAGKAALENAVARYLEGSAVIRARPANLVRLFNYDLDQANREARFRCTLVDVRNSLQAPTVLCLESNYVIYFANYFSPANPPRRWLPRFGKNDVEIGSFPDLTFGGIVGGLTEPFVEELVSHHVDMVSTIHNPTIPANGRFTCEFPTLADRVYALEYSTDLRNWGQLLQFYSEGGTYAFIDGGARNAAYRFYRLAEVSRFKTVRGEVRDGCSLAPIANATVRLNPWTSHPQQTTATDSSGRFTIRTFPGPAYLSVSAPTYYQHDAYFNGNSSEVKLYLTPISIPRPANTDFTNRLQLTGLPASIQTGNCGADEFQRTDVWIGYYPVWFTWTAPISGKVVLQAAGTIEDPVIAAFFGTTLANLSYVSSGYRELQLEAAAGATYQISVGTPSQQGQFTLRISGLPQLDWQVPLDRAEFTAPANISFGVSAIDPDGTIAEVRYYANGKWIGQVTTPPYDFTWENVPADIYQFEVRVKDSQGLSVSEYRQVAVRPPNDNFAKRRPLTGAPLRVKGTNKAATAEPGEPPLVGHSVWWSWRPQVSGYATVLIERADGHDRQGAFIAVATGSSLNQLTGVTQSEPDYDPDVPLHVSFMADSQTEYQIVVDGYYTGEFQLRILPTAAPQVAILEPANNAVFLGPANILVRAHASDPDANLSRVELSANGRLLHVSTSEDLLFQWTNVLAGNYTLSARAVDALGVFKTSVPVRIRVNPPPPPNDNFANRIAITGTSGRFTGSTDAATKELGEPNNLYPYSGNSIWWKWTAPASGWLSIADVTGDWYKRLEVFKGNSVSTLATVGYYSGFSPWLGLFVEAGEYQIYVEGVYGDSGNVDMAFSFVPD